MRYWFDGYWCTFAFIAKKLINTTHSYTRQTQCSKNMCTEPLFKIGYVVSINAFDGHINLQTEIYILFKLSIKLCILPNCSFNKIWNFKT